MLKSGSKVRIKAPPKYIAFGKGFNGAIARFIRPITSNESNHDGMVLCALGITSDTQQKEQFLIVERNWLSAIS